MSYGALVLNAKLMVTPAAIPAATFVGANNFLSSSGNATLPAGCLAGDWLIISPQTNVAVTLSAPVADPVIASRQVGGTGTHYYAVFAYRLTATDISNGYVAISTNAGRSQLAVVRTSQTTNPVDVSNTGDGANAKPMTVTVGSITTTGPGDLLLAIGAFLPGGSVTGTAIAPSGWTLASTLDNVSYKGLVAYVSQPSAGATGAVTCGFDNGNFGLSSAALIAIKP